MQISASVAPLTLSRAAAFASASLTATLAPEVPDAFAVFAVFPLFVWFCAGLVYISGLVLGLVSMVLGLLGVAVLITYSPQNGLILLVLAFLVSPYGLPLAAIWLLGKVQDLKFVIQDLIYG